MAKKDWFCNVVKINDYEFKISIDSHGAELIRESYTALGLDSAEDFIKGAFLLGAFGMTMNNLADRLKG